MSYLTYNSAPFDSSLMGSTNELLGDPQMGSYINQSGSGKKRRLVKKKKLVGKKKTTKKSTKKTTKKSTSTKKRTTKKSVKKVKEMDKFTKVKLEKIAKKNGISCYRKDGSRKTKSQLFRTLKKKKLV